ELTAIVDSLEENEPAATAEPNPSAASTDGDEAPVSTTTSKSTNESSSAPADDHSRAAELGAVSPDGEPESAAAAFVQAQTHPATSETSAASNGHAGQALLDDTGEDQTEP